MGPHWLPAGVPRLAGSRFALAGPHRLAGTPGRVRSEWRMTSGPVGPNLACGCSSSPAFAKHPRGGWMEPALGCDCRCGRVRMTAPRHRQQSYTRLLSVGPVDTWGVDYALLRGGRLWLSNPVQLPRRAIDLQFSQLYTRAQVIFITNAELVHQLPLSILKTTFSQFRFGIVSLLPINIMPSMASSHGGVVYYVVSVPREQNCTESGWDNPFRPGGDLSREADEIVELIKGGKPITPTSGGPPSPTLLDHTDSTYGNNTAHEPITESPKKATALNSLSATPKSANGNVKSDKATSPGAVDVQRGTLVPQATPPKSNMLSLKRNQSASVV
ncbi:hypothetical protein FQR65_LT19337 [Abscondita terminalis]|nr:hypothetical protein FQR65_LT19337 [Abscondita terminalis]